MENFSSQLAAIDDVTDVVVPGADGDGELLRTVAPEPLDDVSDVVAGGDGRCWRTST